MSREVRGVRSGRTTRTASRKVILSLASQIIEHVRASPAESVLVRQDTATCIMQGDVPGYLVTTFPKASLAWHLTGHHIFKMLIKKSMAPIRVLVVNRDGAAFWEFSAEYEVILGGYCPFAIAANGAWHLMKSIRLGRNRAKLTEQIQQLRAEGLVPLDFEPAALARLHPQLTTPRHRFNATSPLGASALSCPREGA